MLDFLLLQHFSLIQLPFVLKFIKIFDLVFMVNILLTQFTMITLGIYYLAISSETVQKILLRYFQSSFIIFDQRIFCKSIFDQLLDIIKNFWAIIIRYLSIYFYPFWITQFFHIVGVGGRLGLSWMTSDII